VLDGDLGRDFKGGSRKSCRRRPRAGRTRVRRARPSLVTVSYMRYPADGWRRRGASVSILRTSFVIRRDPAVSFRGEDPSPSASLAAVTLVRSYDAWHRAEGRCQSQRDRPARAITTSARTLPLYCDLPKTSCPSRFSIWFRAGARPQDLGDLRGVVGGLFAPHALPHAAVAPSSRLAHT
jgi:hypothetical protein